MEQQTRQITIGYDFSLGAARAMQVAGGLCRAFDARLEVVVSIFGLLDDRMMERIREADPRRSALETEAVALERIERFARADIQRLHMDDIEQSLLRIRLLRHLPFGHVPTLVELTYAAHEVIAADLEELVLRTTDASHSDYALLTGILIHGPTDSWVWPGTRYARVAGDKTPLWS